MDPNMDSKLVLRDISHFSSPIVCSSVSASVSGPDRSRTVEQDTECDIVIERCGDVPKSRLAVKELRPRDRLSDGLH